MFPGVHHFLLDKGADLARQFGRNSIAMRLYSLDEIGFTARKGYRQCVEKGGADRFIIEPPTILLRLASETAIARGNL